MFLNNSTERNSLMGMRPHTTMNSRKLPWLYIVPTVVALVAVCFAIIVTTNYIKDANHPTTQSYASQWADTEPVDPSCLHRDDPNAASCVVTHAVKIMQTRPEGANYGMGPNIPVQGIDKAVQVIEDQDPYRWSANNRASFNPDMTITLTVDKNKILALTVSDSQGPHVVEQTVLQYP